MKSSPIIKAEDLFLINSSEIVIIDASAASQARYHQNPLSGALFADVNKDPVRYRRFPRQAEDIPCQAVRFHQSEDKKKKVYCEH